jgi:uncharacterized protein with PQ loop repeat
MTSHPDAATARSKSGDDPKHPAFLRLLNAFSIVTMAMTVPQAVAVWRGDAAGVSLLSWGAYLVSACLWMVHGVREGDKAIWVPCIGWIALDVAIVLGIVLRG